MNDMISPWQIPISVKEVAWACQTMRMPPDAFSGSDGSDPRLSALTSLESLDIEACPGSGKTTLLVAKLAILANRWSATKQGICVLSHTNAARDEIGDKFGSSSVARNLLSYPHFVGTIHSFVNEFLALPWLRSNGRQIKVIDDWIALNNRWNRLHVSAQGQLKRLDRNAIFTVTYTKPDFSGGVVPPSHKVYSKVVSSCRRATEAGFYCYDDMFVWAHELLDRHPDVASTLRDRFPIVFIDEVQDNSEIQSAFLHRLFLAGPSSAAIRQRFGDSNQAIYNRAGGTGATTDPFPGPNRVDLPNSFRFGQKIADVTAGFGVRPQPLVGLGPSTARVEHASLQSTLILFDDTTAVDVLPKYAGLLIDGFSDDARRKGDFTAICAVHRSGESANLPRFLGHYYPSYNPDLSGRQPKPKTLGQFLTRARGELTHTRNAHPVVSGYAEAILQCLRTVGADVPMVLRKSANRYFRDRIEDETIAEIYHELLDQLIQCRGSPSEAFWRDLLVPGTKSVVAHMLQAEIDENETAAFFEWEGTVVPDGQSDASRKSGNIFRYPIADPKIAIRMGSIHGVKGETHTATLVLESFNRTHNLRNLKSWLLGKRPMAGSDNQAQQASVRDRLKLHYVGMTRASHFLCLAMRQDTFTAAEIDQLRIRGWNIEICATDAPN
ncbi:MULTISPECIES: UvrD-helicase domain-containing protein [Rhizobium]|uniref:UvrD-helicase domain-containing protein n=1 Tax=Rhizobium TaxID=379 RepID=UPI00103F0440|nr:MULTISPECIES: UvrD-helicase domain-containing protein [Rhizobium]MBX5159619.1 ATP-dependent helicase [Rhizobium sp. NZLR8]TCA84441.1 ATP-dependent helicase [Rhizobium leguminosarum bv. viciae]TCA94674.1 ATP-dependent helicase [Rhizobium leguminosarum bv. viciae]